MSATVEGIDRFRSTLDRAGEQLADLSETDQDAGRLLAAAGAAASPRRTGRLAQAHGHTVRAGAVVVTAATPYAARVHARNPWLVRTLDRKLDDLEQLYATGVSDAVNTITGA